MNEKVLERCGQSATQRASVARRFSYIRQTPSTLAKGTLSRKSRVTAKPDEWVLAALFGVRQFTNTVGCQLIVCKKEKPRFQGSGDVVVSTLVLIVRLRESGAQSNALLLPLHFRLGHPSETRDKPARSPGGPRALACKEDRGGIVHALHLLNLVSGQRTYDTIWQQGHNFGPRRHHLRIFRREQIGRLVDRLPPLCDTISEIHWHPSFRTSSVHTRRPTRAGILRPLFRRL